MSLADITTKLSEHYDPKPLVIVERYHFHKREQAPTESLAEYVAELRRLAAKCNFEMKHSPGPSYQRQYSETAAN